MLVDIKSLEIESAVSKLGIEFTIGDKVVFVPDYIDHIKTLDIGFTGDEVGTLSEFVEVEQEPMVLVYFNYKHLKVKNFAEVIEKWMLVQ